MQVKEVAMAFFSRKQPDLDGEINVPLLANSFEFLLYDFVLYLQKHCLLLGSVAPCLTYDTLLLHMVAFVLL